MPFITLLGKSLCARTAASILTACDLKELVTVNESEYEKLAYELATDSEKFNSIKKKIKDKASCSFFDSQKFTDDLEAIFKDSIVSNTYS